MNPPSAILVIGAGAAGAAALLALRRLGYEGRIDLVGEEAVPPYKRPPLSKEVLTSQEEVGPALLTTDTTLRELEVRAWLSSSATSLDMSGGFAHLEPTGNRIAFDRVLLATGAAPRQLSIPGATLDGALYLRTFDDALRLRSRLGSGDPVVIIGGGFIGLEVAAAARARGCPVTVVECGSRLMARAVPAIVSQVFHAKHLQEGVSIELRRQPVRLLGTDALEGVELDDGRIVPARTVVIGVGVIPRQSLAERIGASVDDGIVVDSESRTSLGNVFAAGDCCRVQQLGEGRGVRLEAWQSALDQGTRAAYAMLGMTLQSAEAPWMWSDQYDFQLQAIGAPALVDQICTRGDVDRAEFTAFLLHRGHLVGAVSVNRRSEIAVVRRVLASRPTVDPDDLTNEQWPLRRLLHESSGKPSALAGSQTQ